MNRLTEIFDSKRAEVAESKRLVSVEALKDEARGRAALDFIGALRAGRAEARGGLPLGLIAEVKKASPSAGLIRADLDPVEVARSYKAAGAHCLSVLTDRKYFQGAPENLTRAKQATSLPCLRKDFMFDEYQLWEAKAWGADAVLLIVAGLDEGALKDLHCAAVEMGLQVLVEVHDEREVEVALGLGAELIGVNNRDLRDFVVRLETAERLIPLIGPHALAVAESGIANRDDLDRMAAVGAGAVLIGSAFCQAPDITAKAIEVMGWSA